MTRTNIEPLPFDAALSNQESYESFLSASVAKVVGTTSSASPTPGPSHNTFFDSLRNPIFGVHERTVNPTAETSNLTLTANLGVTLASSLSPLVDLYTSLGSLEAVPELRKLLETAWSVDAGLTLKIIWSARSIPRGRGQKEAFMRGAAWLAEAHPQTFLRNLAALVNPVDRVAKGKKKEQKDEAEMGAEETDEVEESEEEEEEELGPANAKSHGYFKDLLNLVVLSSLLNSTTSTGTELALDGDYSRVPGFSVTPTSQYAPLRTKAKRRALQPTLAIEAPKIDPAVLVDPSSESNTFHRALRLTVARLFGAQLQSDLTALQQATLLRSEGKHDDAVRVEKTISLAAKWAPSEGAMHDRLTRIAETVAELLAPAPVSRTASWRTATLASYRSKYLVPLRRHLEIVEVKMSAREWDTVKYNRVPSLAMSNSKSLFYKHDEERFRNYLLDVAAAKAKISGSVMTPAVLLKQAAGTRHSRLYGWSDTEREAEMEAQVAEAQWGALVQSIKNAGSLSRCIAVVDVSGSMNNPMLMDGTVPLHSSMALGILISELTAPPFSNAIISFSESPHFVDLVEGLSLAEKYHKIETEGMGYTTDFIAVFRLILSRAVSAKLTQDDMVERIFVFSDMEFNSACPSAAHGRYATHYQIIQAEFSSAGYVVPELVFWNLAGARTTRRLLGAQVEHDQPGTAMLSGYSAAMVKVFLEGGLGVDDEEDIVVLVQGEDGETKELSKREKMTPEKIMLKALGHESFDGLKVFD